MGRNKKVTAEEVLQFLIDKGVIPKRTVAEYFKVCDVTIRNRVRELREDGEAIIHGKDGLLHIDKNGNMEDEEIADSLRAWYDWLLSIIKGLTIAATPTEPLMITMKRTLRESLTSEERKKLSKACAKVKALLDYEEAYSEDT